MRALTLLLVASVALAGCKKQQRDDDDAPIETVDEGLKPRTKALIADLQAGGGRATRAVDHIHKLSTNEDLSVADGEAFLRALPAVPPPADGEPDPQTYVMQALGQYFYDEWIPTIEEVIAELREPPRLHTMSVLAGIDTANAVAAFVRLLGRFPTPAPVDAFDQLQRHRSQPDAAFPALLDVLRPHPELFFHVVLTALYYAENDRMPAGVLASNADWLFTNYDALMEVVRPAQRPRGGVAWLFDDDYRFARADAALLIDLFGSMPFELVERRLAGALTLHDPKLAAFAAESWLDHGRTPPPAVLELISASHETRAMVWEDLERRGKLELFPRKFHDQASLGAGLLARVLREDPETDRAPDEIELVGTVQVDTASDDGTVAVYVYRFQLDDETWYEGWAGPFRTKDGITTDHPNGTGTDFTEASGRAATEIYTPDELLTNWRTYRAKYPPE